ncbi:hypothetical protein MTO96_029058 [Rhipicephalus appendiculatus]
MGLEAQRRMGGSRTLFCILQSVVGAAGCGNCSQVPSAGAFAIGPTASEVSSNATSPGLQWLNFCSHDQLQGFLPYRALPQLVAAAGTSTDPPTPRLKPSAAQSPLNGLGGTTAMGGSRTLFCILQSVVGAAGCGNCSQVPSAGAFAIGPTASEVSSNATSPGLQWLNFCSHDQLQGFLPYRALPQLVAAAGTSTDPPTPRLKPSAAQSPLNGLGGTTAMGGSRTLFCILQSVVGAAGCGNCSQVPSAGAFAIGPTALGGVQQRHFTWITVAEFL